MCGKSGNANKGMLISVNILLEAVMYNPSTSLCYISLFLGC